jgi:hypothetical protein
METVFSHIVRTRLSQESENVATTALSFILESSEDARNGILKLLRGVLPNLPRLWFRTQQTDGESRPDMWGYDDEATPHVFIENKFWAGLTENQPVSYLRKLARRAQPALLLVVVPHSREQAVWRELTRRLEGVGISTADREVSAGIVFNVMTGLGPNLALTSWAKLLSFLEVETTNDPSARSNLLQLRALCDQADNEAFIPFSPQETSDQRLPSMILQVTSIVQEVTELAFDKRVLYKGKKIKLSSNSTRIGLYASLLADDRCGLWFGLHFGLWKKHGGTPLWGIFSTSNWGRATEVRALLEPWASKNGSFTASEPDGPFVVAFNIPLGQEKNIVVRGVVDRLKEIGSKLSVLKPNQLDVVTGDPSSGLVTEIQHDVLDEGL